MSVCSQPLFQRGMDFQQAFIRTSVVRGGVFPAGYLPYCDSVSSLNGTRAFPSAQKSLEDAKVHDSAVP